MIRGDDHEDDTPERDLNWFRAAHTPKATAWTQEMIALVEAGEDRKRRRRTRDALAFSCLLKALLADLALSVIGPNPNQPQPLLPLHESPKPFLRLSTSTSRKADRYAPKWSFGAGVGTVLRGLLRAGLIDQREGGWTPDEGKHRGAIRATEAFVASVRSSGLTIRDFAVDLGSFEPVRLRSPKERGRVGHERPGLLIDYRETSRTLRWRAELKRAGRYLVGLDLQCNLGSYLQDDGKSGWRRVAVDPLDRAVFRLWNNGKWDQGGRLYGGFWTRMPKVLRREHLRIGGRPVRHCDFGQLFVRLAYALQGEEPDGGDLYAVAGWEDAREVVKTFLNASFYRRGRPEALPHGTRDALPPAYRDRTGRDLRRAVEARHPTIAPLFGTDVGYRLFGMEGAILMRALQLGEEAGLSMLPLHDCCLCPNGEEGAVVVVMTEAFREVTGLKDAAVVVT